MPSLRWEPSLSVGITELDQEHRRLISAINDICEAFQAGHPKILLDSLFTALARETEKHFSHEISLMQEIGTITGRAAEAAAEHDAEHARDLQELHAMRLAAADCASEEICAELKRWFLDHTVNHDEPLKTIFGGR